MLQSFVTDFSELKEERDIHILVLTLSGIINDDLTQLEKAKELSSKTTNY